MNWEIVELKRTRLNELMAGFYAVDREQTDTSASDWCWNDRGNGPEVTKDGVFGPFSTEHDAREFVQAQAD